MNINEVYEAVEYVVVDKQSGECLFGTRTFTSPKDCKTAYSAARRYNSWAYSGIRELPRKFDDQDKFKIVKVKIIMHEFVEELS